MPNLEARLDRLGITIPEAPKPVASYVPSVAVHSGSLVFISGQLPFEKGKLMATGRVPGQVSIETAQKCARQCVVNGLAALLGEIGSFERLRRVVRLGVFVNAGEGFAEQPKVGNGASDLLVELLGENGRHARAAVGVSSLPLDAPVEIEFTFLVD
ncbi:MAG: RidA family protein [Phycisphaeraceae bacterium]|nr:RidA family protein [Phycisphaerales bacterium]MCB9843107.1 RidA family protein [Phycisphaeraceae bacterium]